MLPFPFRIGCTGNFRQPSSYWPVTLVTPHPIA